jgi:hypothetical protein
VSLRKAPTPGEAIHLTAVPVVHVLVAHSVAPMKILGVASASAKLIPEMSKPEPPLGALFDVPKYVMTDVS